MFWKTEIHHELAHAATQVGGANLLNDNQRSSSLQFHYNKWMLDLSHENLSIGVMKNLQKLYSVLNIDDNLKKMYTGIKINTTEQRAVGHTALRNGRFVVDNHDYSEDIKTVLDRIYKFSDKVRNGLFTGYSGKLLQNILVIGIGGSYLGVEYVVKALECDPRCIESSKNRKLVFIANVDPVNAEQAIRDIDPSETLVVVISKTFTTAETMLNYKTVQEWILKHYGGDKKAIACHVCAVSSAVDLCVGYGISSENIFNIWDFVGGRYSVTSAVGAVPISLLYGPSVFKDFLKGANSIDKHTIEKGVNSIPTLMALTLLWNVAYLNHSTVAILPYSQALSRFPAHIQQLSMESNGKRVTLDGCELPTLEYSGEICFGEPGTNGQHSFYQLIHQGRIVPCEFIGFCKSQADKNIDGHPISSHDELMCNFFAQPDALAFGKSAEDLRAERVPESLINHKVFPGNRPSLSLLCTEAVDPFTVGELLAIYEHKTVIYGFLIGVNSFDQWGVELGKTLAKSVRDAISMYKKKLTIDSDKIKCSSTRKLIEFYLGKKQK